MIPLQIVGLIGAACQRPVVSKSQTRVIHCLVMFDERPELHQFNRRRDTRMERRERRNQRGRTFRTAAPVRQTIHAPMGMGGAFNTTDHAGFCVRCFFRQNWRRIVMAIVAVIVLRRFRLSVTLSMN